MKEIYAQLSGREKRLLYILICFLIVVAGWFFVITPTIDSYIATSAQYDSIVAQKPTLEKQLKDYLDAPDQLKIKKDNYEAIIAKYNPLMSNEKIDKLLTTAFLSHRLKPISLSINNDANVVLNQQDQTNKSEEEKDTTISSNLVQATVTVSVKGTFEQISNVVAYLDDMKGIEISNFNYGGDSDDSNTSITIVVYMFKK